MLPFSEKKTSDSPHMHFCELWLSLRVSLSARTSNLHTSEGQMIALSIVPLSMDHVEELSACTYLSGVDVSMNVILCILEKNVILCTAELHISMAVY